jgi:hypothetical protein
VGSRLGDRDHRADLRKHRGEVVKPSAQRILDYLRLRGEYVTSTDIIRDCFTTTPSKRLDELHDAGLIDKRPRKGREMEYRALTMPEILLRRTG